MSPHSLESCGLRREQISRSFAALRMTGSFVSDYFSGLRHGQIDIRTHLKDVIRDDWSFKNLQGNAPTWHYYLYLASLNQPGAYAALSKKIKSTKNGNDATNLLRSLADLKTPEVGKILSTYKNDIRRADGPSGPGPTIA